MTRSVVIKTKHESQMYHFCIGKRNIVIYIYAYVHIYIYSTHTLKVLIAQVLVVQFAPPEQHIVIMNRLDLIFYITTSVIFIHLADDNLTVFV